MPLLRLIRNPTLLLFLFSLAATNLLHGQTPAIEWQKCLGSNNEDEAKSIQPTSDGGYIVAGSSEGANGDVVGHHGNPSVGDIWLVKLDKYGNIQWQKCLGGSDSEDGASILQTPDGGYIFAGAVASWNCDFTGNHGGFDFWIVRLNDKGDIIWQKMYGGSNAEGASSLSPTADGGYIVAGSTSSNDGDVKGNHGLTDYWVIKIDGSGNLIWQKCLGGADYDQATSVQTTADGGCIVGGFTSSKDGNVTGNHGSEDYWLVKLDKSGSIQWQKTFGGTAADLAWCVQVAKDGGYVLAGTSGSYDGDVTGKHPPGNSDYDVWIIKVDNLGNIQWKKCYGGGGEDEAYGFQLTSDGGYVVTGSSSSSDGDLTCNSGQGDCWVFKISSSGDLEWQENFGGSGQDVAEAIQTLNDGSFIVAGNTSSSNIAGFHPPGPPNNVGGDDILVVKLSAPVTVTPNPTVTIDPANICAGIPSALRASTLYAGLNPTYQWTRNGIPVGTNDPVYTAPDFQENDLITCAVTNGGPSCNNSGLQATKSLTIHINNNLINPSIKIAADNTFVCDCITNTFTATVTNAGSSSVYQWQINGQNTGATSPIFSSNALSLGDIITCVYSDKTSCVAGGSLTSNAIQLNNTASGISVNVAASTDSVCAGTTVTFNANPVNAGANPVYQWKRNNTDVGDNSPTFSSNELSNGDQVSCIVTISSACSSASVPSNTLTMTIKSSPVINITPQDTLIHAGDQLQLNGAITGSISSFQWTPPDKLENPTALSPTTIHLQDSTRYTLTATSNEGCTVNKSVLVKIFKPLFMPNAFTPNADGKNDVFRIPADALLTLDEFSIYDRWGNKIFSTKNIAKGWDGTINGIQQATGVYVYIINGSNEKGRIFLKGSFILIR